MDDVDDSSAKAEGSNEEEQLPILPPIILLDFGNSTDDENVTSEEKSKRTVNNGLGYGLDQNSLQPRRYNYYFPAGKSGTTVSIEESVSPFLPKTIIERVQPSNHRGFLGTQQNSFVPTFSAPQAQAQIQPDLRYLNLQQSSKSQAAFGSRTKPQKAPTASSFDSYQSFGAAAKPQVSSFGIQNPGYRANGGATTPSPLVFSPTETARYVTPSPASLANPQSGLLSYSTPGPLQASASAQLYAGQRQHAQSNINSHGFGYLSQTVKAPTFSSSSYNSRFTSSDSPQLPSNPRYTVENGVRYENKIFWKYPDGRVSDVPPGTYVETYSDYPQQALKSQPANSIYEASTTTENSILSQGPVQFPSIAEQNEQVQTRFVSSESLSSSLPQQQAYRLGYQSLVGQRQNLNLAQQRRPAANLATSYTFSSSSTSGRTKASSNSQKAGYKSPYQQVPSRYMVNSPNPEYTVSYTTEPSIINSTTPISYYGSSGESSSRVTSKYTPEVQNYLESILGANEGPKKQSPGSNDLSSYSNLQYSDLLNYNPSISEYIRNPSSILNVRPTFVQAGNSLIPVIILRVDGASPIQAKGKQNVNLKALLQQYLIQYANSIQDLAQPSTYDLGTAPTAKDRSPEPTNSPVLDLIRLTQEDARQPPSYNSDSYIGRSSYETSNLEDAKDFLAGHYGERTAGRQKVKNVQIVDDPRFTTYNLKN